MKKFLLSPVGLGVVVLVVLLVFAFWRTHSRALQPAPEAEQAVLITWPTRVIARPVTPPEVANHLPVACRLPRR